MTGREPTVSTLEATSGRLAGLSGLMLDATGGVGDISIGHNWRGTHGVDGRLDVTGRGPAGLTLDATSGGPAGLAGSMFDATGGGPAGSMFDATDGAPTGLTFDATGGAPTGLTFDATDRYRQNTEQ